jgi:hypothetical protein
MNYLKEVYGDREAEQRGNLGSYCDRIHDRYYPTN